MLQLQVKLPQIVHHRILAFHILYHKQKNTLLGAPTGSGKTISEFTMMLLSKASAPSHQKHINKLSAKDHLALEVATVSDLQSKARPGQKKFIDKAQITDFVTEAAHYLNVWHTNSVGLFLYGTFCDFFTSVMVRVAKSIDALIKIGDEKEHKSSDSVCLADEDSNFDDSIYTIEFPNGLRMSAGRCNGTRLQVLRLRNNIIEAKIISGGSIGKMCAISHMIISPTDTKMSFKLNRRQFPIQVCFAMTINKSQGQTLSQVRRSINTFE
nr:hypothetical protein [Tanacetum cinerariifolium]